MRASFLAFAMVTGALAASCGTDDDVEAPANVPAPTLRADVTPVTSTAQAKRGVFIPPFVDCRAPKDGKAGMSDGGNVCTPVAISGATEPGRYFPDYAACDVVRTQRPYFARPAAGSTKSDDPRLTDEAFQKELAWVTEQVAATGCTCCHDSRTTPQGPSQWYIDAKGIWTDTVSDSGIALFSGLADSSVLGAYPKEKANGFERKLTGLPSTDPARMRAFFVKELARRGISESKAASIPPFGGPIYDNFVRKPEVCPEGVGVDGSGMVNWIGPAVRYLYVLEAGSQNPGVPPNLDLPTGTVFRVDVLASQSPIESGFRYGTTPEGSFQAFPETGRAPALKKGSTYQLFASIDVGLPITNCTFVY